jgi:hypothetical protein
MTAVRTILVKYVMAMQRNMIIFPVDNMLVMDRDYDGTNINNIKGLSTIIARDAYTNYSNMSFSNPQNAL